jgi:hypothetical protein
MAVIHNMKSMFYSRSIQVILKGLIGLKKCHIVSRAIGEVESSDSRIDPKGGQIRFVFEKGLKRSLKRKLQIRFHG